MSTTTQLPTTDEIAATAKVAATKAIETGAYTVERGRQEAGALNAQANAASPSSGQTTRESLDRFETGMSAKTNQAVEQGKSDVHHAAQTSETYLEKALQMVDAGLSATQGYLVAGKERLTAPAVGSEPPASAGIGAQIASTATAALDVAARGVGYAQHTLHERGQNFPHSHTTNEPAHPVTIPAKPMGQALADNASAAQATVQPQVDSAMAASQPYREAAQPYVDATAANVNAAASGLQGQINAAKGAMPASSSDKPVMQQAQEAGQAAVDTAKPYVAAAGDAAASTMLAAGDKLNSATSTAKPGDPTYTV